MALIFFMEGTKKGGSLAKKNGNLWKPKLGESVAGTRGVGRWGLSRGPRGGPLVFATVGTSLGFLVPVVIV